MASVAAQLPTAVLRRGCHSLHAVDEDNLRYPVVLVHGYAGTDGVWSAARRALRDAGFGHIVCLNYNSFSSDPADVAVITNGLRAYYVNQAGYYDFRPLAVFVRDPQTGKVVGGLHGRSEFGLVYVAWFFLPEHLRRVRIGSRVLAMAEEEGRRRGCTRIALTTLSIRHRGSSKKNRVTISWRRSTANRPASRAIT